MRYLLCISLLVGLVCADVYLHNPRGSNNRINENSANRANANRLFNSQNNNRGGYNVGDKTNKKASNESGQYRMMYFQSGTVGKSHLTFEWTNQHGCGGNDQTDPHKQNCNIVLQLLCQPYDENNALADDDFTIRNGDETKTQAYSKQTAEVTEEALNAARAKDVTPTRGLNEGWDNYNSCYLRQRNERLFTADQTLKSNSATNTRQSPNGEDNRYGYECPEERDYYPYWHPTPFTDIAVLTDDISNCNKLYKSHSFNRARKHECVEKFDNNKRKPFSQYNEKEECTAAGGVWTAYYQYDHIDKTRTSQAACEGTRDGRIYKWAKPYDLNKIKNHETIVDTCLGQPAEVICEQAPWSRTNHLGNGRDGAPASFQWTIPKYTEDKQCILRIRYNISTDDYDPFNTDSTKNGAASPVQNNPLETVGANNEKLKLALNTQQTGRTFQDRTHVFILKQRPDSIPDEDTLYNINVRGKRGNIVQTFPAVEYDFYPTRPEIKKDDLVHIQWTGSNSHNNGNPAGDGQSGSAGEGTAGTDRHNLVEIPEANSNYPTPIEQCTMFNDAQVVWEDTNVDVSKINSEAIALRFASAGEYRCKLNGEDACGGDNKYSIETRPLLDGQLNGAPASFRGIVLRFTKRGIHHYMCSRNNNFTNRSQKGKLTIK